MSKTTTWRDWANENELSMLLMWRLTEVQIMRDRKKIRDRCYQRARRAKEKE